MYQNLYASGYDGSKNEVTLDGYYDPTKRENMFLNGNLVREVETGGITHTLLVGAEYVDTNNANLRYDSCHNVSSRC